VALDSFLIELNRRSARFASRDGDNRLGLDWLHNGTLRVGSRAWAVWSGLSGRSCMWSPKLSGGNLGVLQMVDYASGLDALKRIEGNRDLGAGGRQHAGSGLPAAGRGKSGRAAPKAE
jgi:hypothetical protein